ncbi:GNAT family N-acetyltransferase [Microbacterium sp.]|uniref:GNAT family N-acetyltransferase n=1 Tax=Microbacterium sp. TaxID=51671 RepID=UPI003A938D9A
MPFTDTHVPAPATLATPEFRLRPLTTDDAARDHAALMETREQLRLWEQSTWPADDFTVDDNRADLAGLQQRHAEGRAYTYAMVDPRDRENLGCVYVFPTTAAFLARSTVTPVGTESWDDVDAVVYFWVRASRVPGGTDARLLAALREWFRDAWGFARTAYVTNEQFTQQVELFGGTDLDLAFELREPGKPGTYLIYA